MNWLLLGLALVGVGLLGRKLLLRHGAGLRHAAQELRAKEAQLRALGDNLPDAVIYQVMRDVDGSMRILYVSEGIERINQLSAEAVLQDSSLFYDQIVPEDRAKLDASRDTSLQQRSSSRVTVRIRRSDGVIRWVQLSSAPRSLPDGRTVWDGVETDVTALQRTEAALTQSEARFARIFEVSPIPMTLARLDDGIHIDANPSFLRWSGFTREEVIGKTTLDLQLYPNPESRAVLLEALRQYCYLHEFPQVFRTKHGQFRHNLLWLDAIVIDNQKCLLVIALDVTERRQAEEQQRLLEEQLRQAQKLDALGTLAGGIAHDFNNILAGIISFTELSRLDNPQNRELQDNLHEVLSAAGRATSLVRQILSFSRSDKYERKHLQVAPIVREVLKLLRATLPTTIELQITIAPELPDVSADSTQLHQVLMNLGTNAAHAMRGGPGVLRVALDLVRFDGSTPKPHAELSAGSYVRLLVADTGHGMDEATRERAFEPFFTTKTQGEGTGLGLSVVHGIVKEHGGAITLESALGKGTSFSIFLPASTSAVVQRPAGPASAPRGHGERVVFVDDEPMLGNAAQKMLRRLGYEPTIFDRSEAALVAFKNFPAGYDALITDMTMPVMTGLDLAREVLKLSPELPIILTSGSGGGLTESVRALGIRELVTKPLDYEGLAQVLQRVLQHAATQRSSTS